MGLFESKVPLDGEFAFLVYEDSYPGKKISKKQIMHDAQLAIGNTLRIINDCVRIVNESKDPDTFFKRLDMMIEKMEWMAKIEKYYPFQRPLPSEQLNKIKSNMIMTYNDFIDRYYKSVVQKIIKVKTEKSRMNKIEEFYNTLTYYSDRFFPENIQKYTELYSRYLPETYQQR